MKFKILNGTPNHSEPSLCFSCANGHVVQGQAISNFSVHCMVSMSGNGILIKGPVTHCSDYGRRWDQGLREMKEIAHILITKKGRPVGFVSPTEAKNRIKEGTADNTDDTSQVREVQDNDD
jgi:hypothetical protein